MNEAQVRHDLIDPALRRRVRRPADRLAPPPRIETDIQAVLNAPPVDDEGVVATHGGLPSVL